MKEGTVARSAPAETATTTAATTGTASVRADPAVIRAYLGPSPGDEIAAAAT